MAFSNVKRLHLCIYIYIPICIIYVLHVYFVTVAELRLLLAVTRRAKLLGAQLGIQTAKLGFQN